MIKSSNLILILTLEQHLSCQSDVSSKTAVSFSYLHKKGIKQLQHHLHFASKNKIYHWEQFKNIFRGLMQNGCH